MMYILKSILLLLTQSITWVILSEWSHLDYSSTSFALAQLFAFFAFAIVCIFSIDKTDYLFSRDEPSVANLADFLLRISEFLFVAIPLFLFHFADLFSSYASKGLSNEERSRFIDEISYYHSATLRHRCLIPLLELIIVTGLCGITKNTELIKKLADILGMLALFVIYPLSLLYDFKED